MKINCVVCGKEFERRSRAKTCGQKCSKELKREITRKWGEAHREKIREYNRKHYYKKNPNAQVHANCVVCGKTFKRLGYAKTCGKQCSHEMEREYFRKWQALEVNREKARERQHKYNQTHKEKRREWLRKWRAANREKVNEHQRKYYAADPEKFLERRRKYSTAAKTHLPQDEKPHKDKQA